MVSFKGEKRLPDRKGVIFVIYKDGKVLLEDRKHPDKPYFGYRIIPGGKLETNKDSSFEEAAKREVLEECGIVVKKLIYLDNFLHMGFSHHIYDSIAYLVTKYEGEIKNNEGKADHVWVEINEASNSLPFSDSRYIIKLAQEALTLVKQT